MDFKSACVVLCAFLTICSAAVFEYIPGIEYEGEIYVPLNIVSGVRVARSPYARRHHHNRGGGDEVGANANAGAEAGTYGDSYGGGGANAKAGSSAIAQGGGFNFPGQDYGGRGGQVAPFYPGGNQGFPGGQGGIGGGNAKAGASGGTDATANSNTQTFVGQGYQATSSSSSASSHTQPGYHGEALAQANAEASAAS